MISTNASFGILFNVSFDNLMFSISYLHMTCPHKSIGQKCGKLSRIMHLLFLF